MNSTGSRLPPRSSHGSSRQNLVQPLNFAVLPLPESALPQPSRTPRRWVSADPGVPRERTRGARFTQQATRRQLELSTGGFRTPHVHPTLLQTGHSNGSTLSSNAEGPAAPHVLRHSEQSRAGEEGPDQPSGQTDLHALGSGHITGRNHPPAEQQQQRVEASAGFLLLPPKGRCYFWLSSLGLQECFTTRSEQEVFLI